MQLYLKSKYLLQRYAESVIKKLTAREALLLYTQEGPMQPPACLARLDPSMTGARAGLSGVGPSASGISVGRQPAVANQQMHMPPPVPGSHVAPPPVTQALAVVPRALPAAHVATSRQPSKPAPVLRHAAPTMLFRDASKGKLSNHGTGPGGSGVAKTCGPCSKVQNTLVPKKGHRCCPYCMPCWKAGSGAIKKPCQISNHQS